MRKNVHFTGHLVATYPFLCNFAPTKSETVNLVIDIGNTRAKLVAFDKDIPVDEVLTDNNNLEALPSFVQKHRFDRGILGSVVDITPKVEAQLNALSFPLLRLNADTPTPIVNRYRSPKTLGADRLAAAVGAYTGHKGRNILVIDAGTCITYEFIDAGGNYWGGNISPGPHMRLKALNTYTAKLPLVEMEGEVADLGSDTQSAILAGVMNGIKFEIEGYIRQYRAKYPDLLVFLTGGDKINFDSTIKNIIFADRFIVPKGLNSILAYQNEI